ncbi:MAG: hypothetical protein H7228_04155 [Polaromonas sp.]|nr:hypothetical protein [Polaromonas sp.]
MQVKSVAFRGDAHAAQISSPLQFRKAATTPMPFIFFTRSRFPVLVSLAGLVLLLCVLCALGGCDQSASAESVGSSSSAGSTEPAGTWAARATSNNASKSGVENPDPGLLLMLVPEGQALDRAEITAWTHAASELGVRLQPVTDKQFMALRAKALQFAGLILPDLSHPIANNELLQAVKSYVEAGGSAMLVYDFGAYALDGNQKPTYPIPRSRLSELAGVDYVLYDELREKSTVVGPVMASRSVMRELQVPPGKSVVYKPENNPQTFALQPPLSSGQTGTASATTTSAELPYTYSGYLLGNLMYSSFVTHGAFEGKVLAQSPVAGLVAGLKQTGKGQVLFVNLPLTYLKVLRTDGLPMHGFLHYFAHNVLGLARLSALPDAVAGLTLNWHLDSYTAQLPALTLEKLGIFNDGPFSIDMTAGPDAVVDGDARGWNLKNNEAARDLLRRFVASGHEVGSHGGWNHDYYGLQANESNSEKFLPYLQKNVSAIRQAISSPIRPYLGFESATSPGTPPVLLPAVQKIKLAIDDWFGPPLRQYSPPVGNNPTWAMDWLEQQGVVAAYFAGHTGLGPTRQYRDGQLRNPAMWVFPVTPEGKYATFEEFHTNHVPKQEVIDWYRESVDFAIAQNTTRMIYMHPNGANVWVDVLRDLLAYAKVPGGDKFRWYTMTRLADFMTARALVQWTERLDATGMSNFEISHPSSLNEMVWLLPKTRYPDQPLSPDGSVRLLDRGQDWEVRAGNTRSARFTARSLPKKALAG